MSVYFDKSHHEFYRILLNCCKDIGVYCTAEEINHFLDTIQSMILPLTELETVLTQYVDIIDDISNYHPSIQTHQMREDSIENLFVKPFEKHPNKISDNYFIVRRS